jgi:hypothetical protein
MLFGLTFTLLFVAGFVSVSTVMTKVNPANSVAHATTSSTINFQARLLQASGAVAPDGTYNVQFNLYTTSSGGSTLWTESYLNSASQGLVTTNGYLSTSLGSITAFPSTIPWDQDLWIGMTVRGTGSCAFGACTPTDGEMTPRMKVTASPYAFAAGKLQTTDGANVSTLGFTTPTATRTINLPDESGTICIQNSTACGFASSSGSGSYIQNGTSTQATANFNIQSASAGSVGGVIQGATSQTADLLQLKTSTPTTVFSVGATGAVLSKNSADSTTAFQIQNAAGTTFVNADSTNQQLSVRNKTDAAVLGSALTPITCSGTNWTGTNPYTHTTGSTAALSCSSPSIVANTTYQIDYTTTSTAGGETFRLAIGGVNGGYVYGNVTNDTQTITTTGTGNFTITPTSSATGSITINSIKIITNNTSAFAVKDSSGTIRLEVRAVDSNTAVGLYSLQSNTTGGGNSAFGSQSLQSNTSGGANTATGNFALQSNTTGFYNTANGYQSFAI